MCIGELLDRLMREEHNSSYYDMHESRHLETQLSTDALPEPHTCVNADFGTIPGCIWTHLRRDLIPQSQNPGPNSKGSDGLR